MSVQTRGIRIGPRRIIDALLRRLRIAIEEVEDFNPGEIPFDNRPDWIGMNLERLMRDPRCRVRPPYIWGVLQGAALGKVLGHRRVSIIELGVEAGNGLLCLERIAEHAEKLIDINIDVYGFDTGVGLPQPTDYRDSPNLWFEGEMPMDVKTLSARLQRASLKLGLVQETIPAFLETTPAPVAFVAVDLDLYSSTKAASKLFEASHDQLLPRVVCYFDDIFGLTYSEYNGERLAINEYNVEHPMRKICPLHGLRYFLPPRHRSKSWPDQIYLAHIFDHPLYNEHDAVRVRRLQHQRHQGTLKPQALA
jgi:hypothetical protein